MTRLFSKKLTTDKKNRQTHDVNVLVEKSGREDAAKKHFSKVGTAEQELDVMIKQSNRMVASASSMFPWDIFPSSVNVEESRVTVIHRQFLATQVHSVDIKDISNVFIDVDLFFAALTIVSSTFAENNIQIMKLRKKDAVLIRRLIEGLRMFISKEIDTSKYTVPQLVEKLKKLSEIETVF